MRKQKQRPAQCRPLKKRGPFALCLNFWIYCAVWLMVLIFTQALRSSLSAMLLIFVTILPFPMLLYALIARAVLYAVTENSAQETVKKTPVTFCIRLNNRSFLPVPFAEAEILWPCAGAVRSEERRVFLSLTPYGRYDMKGHVRFPYRGVYEIGVRSLFVYDLLHMFRIRRTLSQYAPVTVLPRRRILSAGSRNASSDINTDSTRNVRGVDRSEMSDIRIYHPGDPMKAIHWKLSSKTQDLQVRQYDMNAGRTVYIFLDMAAHYDIPDDGVYASDINEFCADRVIEGAMASAFREMKAGNTCRILWYDDRVTGGVRRLSVDSQEELDETARCLASAPLADPACDILKLPALMDEGQGVTLIFVTAYLSPDFAEGMERTAAFFHDGSARCAVELYYCEPICRIISRERAAAVRDTADQCCRQLSGNGFRIIRLSDRSI